jgi:hypothetical protein
MRKKHRQPALRASPLADRGFCDVRDLCVRHGANLSNAAPVEYSTVLRVARDVELLCRIFCRVLADCAAMRGPHECDVRFTPEGGHSSTARECLLCAKSGFMHRSKQHRYSITSSARLCTDCGTVMPSALAVLRLMNSSTFVDCMTGRSAGFSPLRIFPA